MKKTFLICLCIILLATLPIQANATSKLISTAPGIMVLPLPNPVVTDINPVTGVITLSLPDIDPDINANLTAAVALLDADKQQIELAPEVRITDPYEVKVPLVTTLETGHVIVPIIRNNGIENSGVEGVHDGTGGADQNGGNNIGGGGGSGRDRIRTVYVVTETSPEQVVTEKIVETDKLIYVQDSQHNFQTSSGTHERNQSTLSDHSAVADSKKDMAEIPVLHPATDTQYESETAQTSIGKRIALIFMLILCAALIALICTMGYIYYHSRMSQSEDHSSGEH